MKMELEIKESEDKQQAGNGNDQSSSCCEEHHVSAKWMSSKMRIMRKFLGSDRMVPAIKPRRRNQQQQQLHEQKKRWGDREISSGSSDSGGLIRVCSDCSTTKTPLWRGGPLGPKSLCNACGIKQRKARKALIGVAAVSGRAAAAGKPGRKVAIPDSDCGVPFKKRCRFIAAETAPRRLSFEDIVIGLNESLLAFNLVFPQDEKDAAVLLMALSCGTFCNSYREG